MFSILQHRQLLGSDSASGHRRATSSTLGMPTLVRLFVSLLVCQTRLLCLSHPIPVQLGDLSSPIWSSYYMIYMYVNCKGIYSDELHDSDAKYRYWVYFCVLQFNFDAKATQATMKLCSSLSPSGLPLIRGVRLVHGVQHPWCQGFNKCLNFPL